MKRAVSLIGSALLTWGCPSSKPAEDPVPEPPTEAAPSEGASQAASQPAAGPEVVGEEVTYTAGDVELKGFLAYDAALEGKRPGILVVHEWWGHNAYTRDRAKKLAEMGYTALAVDMYGDGKKAEHPDDAKKFMMEVMGNLDVGVARFDAARKLLKDHETTDPEQTAAIGYCFGGGIVLHMARLGTDLDVVGIFHAGSFNTGVPIEKGTIKGTVFVAHGEADPFVKPGAADAFKKEMEAADVDLRFVGYPGVKHAFTNPEASESGQKFELPLEYDEKAAKDSWERFSKILEKAFS